MNINFGYGGRYQFEKFRVDAEGNEIAGTRQVVLPWFDNLITDVGMNLLGSAPSSQNNLAYCRIGTGNTAPKDSDQALVMQVGATKTDGVGGAYGLSMDGTYIYRRVSKRFAAGTISGLNLAEVAMSFSNTGNNAFSRSLLKDISGNPTTITLLSDEVLDVVYELRMYLPPQDIEVAAVIDGVDTTVTIRRATLQRQVDFWAARVGFSIHPDSAGNEQGYPGYSERDATENAIAAATGWNNAGTGNKAAIQVAAYVPGSYTRAVTLTFGLTQANFPTGIGFVTIGTGSLNDSRSVCAFGPWGLIFNPKLNKTNARIATVSFAVTWARYSP
ncbi:hypothetical protein [Stenotrophomonas sp. PS02298]|uniref:hypothetical protein n=1 Tax=Stenotrophomonas sp. PS02298 TaxID=2991424 RepID=UPI00249CC014|nr:hypothetical protein [Stenotrophomonas sp. PS02298]